MPDARLIEWDGQVLGKSVTIFLGADRVADPVATGLETIAAYACKVALLEALPSRQRNPPHQQSVFLEGLRHTSGSQEAHSNTSSGKPGILDQLELAFPRSGSASVSGRNSGPIRLAPLKTSARMDSSRVGAVDLQPIQLGALSETAFTGSARMLRRCRCALADADGTPAPE